MSSRSRSMTSRNLPTSRPSLASHGPSWPIVAPGVDYAYRELGIEGIPAFLLLDAHGRLLASTYANQVADATGEVTLAGLRAWIRHFLPPSTLRKAQPGEGMSAMRQR